MPSLMDVPGLGGYLQAQQLGQQRDMGQLQQAQTLMGILSAVQQQQQRGAALQREQQFRGALSQLPPDASPDQVLQAIRPHADADTLFKGIQGSQDRRFAAEQQANARREALEARLYDIETRAQDRNLAREQQAVLARAADATRREIAAMGLGVRREIAADRAASVPVTPVTIQDPNNPRETIVIDGRTRQVLGKGPKMTQAGAIDAKADLAMGGLGSDLQSAEDLLTGVVRTSDGQVVRGNLPTGSGVGSLVDRAAGLVGMSPSGAAEADQLKTVAARLVSRVPRFEGPQSDKDVALYKEAAGRAGDDSLPRDRRLAAIRQMRSIYAGYESGQRGRITGGRRGNDGATVLRFDAQGNPVQE